MSTDDLFARMTELATCLCAGIDGGEDMCFCGVLPGDQWYDMTGECDDKCGMAWVRLAGTFPSFTLPQPAQGFQACDAPLALQIEVGVIRCLEVPDDGSPPSAAELLAAMQVQHKDMLDMRAVLSCCDAFPEYVLATWAPIGPAGALLGGTWGIVVGEF